MSEELYEITENEKENSEFPTVKKSGDGTDPNNASVQMQAAINRRLMLLGILFPKCL